MEWKNSKRSSSITGTSVKGPLIIGAGNWGSTGPQPWHLRPGPSGHLSGNCPFNYLRGVEKIFKIKDNERNYGRIMAIMVSGILYSINVSFLGLINQTPTVYPFMKYPDENCRGKKKHVDK
jgi:hypothetical protein